LKKDETFSDFTLDGQTIVLEDYLEVHPERREVLKKYII
jgi:alpha-mannosidase